MTEAADAIPERCFRCTYDLRGVADESPCPECGLLASRSRPQTERPRDGNPKHLRRLSFGIWLIVASIIIFYIGNVLTGAAYHALGFDEVQWFQRPPPPPMSFWNQRVYDYWGHVMAIPSDVAALCFVTSVVMLTSRRRLDESPVRIGLTRAFGLVPLALAVLNHWSAQDFIRFKASWATGVIPPTSTQDSLRQIIKLMLFQFGIAPLPLLIFLQLRLNAIKLISRQMTEHSLIVGLGATSTILLLDLIWYLDGQFGLSIWNRKSTAWFIFEGLVYVSASLFALWIAYLLVRFAVAFRIEARASKRSWLAADRNPN